MWRSFIDLIEASDTLKHDIFLNKIELTPGVRGISDAWFSFHLQSRTQTTYVDSSISYQDDTPRLIPYQLFLLYVNLMLMRRIYYNYCPFALDSAHVKCDV